MPTEGISRPADSSLARAIAGMPDAHIGVLVGTPGFGDLVTEVPFYQSLRAAFPHARLHWVGRILPAWTGFFGAYFPDVELVDYHLSNRIPEVLGLTARVPEFRRGHWTLVLDTQRYFVHSLLLRLFGARWTVGYSSRSIFSVVKIPDPKKKDPHILTHLLALLEAIGVPASQLVREARLAPTGEAISVARAVLPPGTARLVGLAPGGGFATKRWPEERWVELAQPLSKAGATVAWFGGPAERQALEALSARVPGSIVPIARDPGLEDISKAGELLRRLSCLIANDTGIAHFACALGTPVCILYGPTRPERFRPAGVGARLAIDHAVECSPCAYLRLEDCPYSQRCLTGILPDEVASAVCPWLTLQDERVRPDSL